MTEAMVVFYDNYTPVGDILVMATIFVFVILMQVAHVNRSKEFHILRGIFLLLFLAATSNVLFYLSIEAIATIPVFIIYTLRWLYRLFLFGVLYLFVLYMGDPLHLNESLDKRYLIVATASLVGLSLYDICGTIFKFGFFIDENLDIHKGFNIFPFGYIIFVGLLMNMLIRFKDKVFRPILLGVITSCCISFIVMYIQGRYGQTSFTTATYLFPCFSVLYLMHASPVDIEMGTAHMDSFENHIAQQLKFKKDFFIVSLYMHDYDAAGMKYPKEIKDKIRDNSIGAFKGAVIFQISGGRTVMAIDALKNPDYEKKFQFLEDLLKKEYPYYRVDYKIVITHSIDRISKENDYIRLLQYIEKRMPDNEVHIITEKEVEGYYEHRYIVDQLADINAKKDLNDPRVLVFCQPVYNARNNQFDTAEALMRLTLKKTGMVFPDRFIPIAESHNYIHMLSMIILAKTCAQIKKFLDEGYHLKRISVNFSMLDVKEKNFCFNVKQIVKDSGIPYDKIAIEITESQNEKDFMTIKDKLYELKDYGITFYLDDFGTGYSNFERIMELPFDIIKFDRSLVIASLEDKKSQTMVSYLAHMFTDMNYSVLYEGIETEDDENRCKDMCGRYLQGYKYSKPLPIEQMTQFFRKIGEV